MGRPRRSAAARPASDHGVEPDAAFDGGAVGGAARRARCCARALQHRRESTCDGRGGLRCIALVRSIGSDVADRGRDSRIPGPPVHRAMCRHRERGRDAIASRRPDARRAGLARNRRRTDLGCVASRAVRGNFSTADRAQQSVERIARMRLPRQFSCAWRCGVADVFRHGRAPLRCRAVRQRGNVRSRGRR